MTSFSLFHKLPNHVSCRIRTSAATEDLVFTSFLALPASAEHKVSRQNNSQTTGELGTLYFYKWYFYYLFPYSTIFIIFLILCCCIYGTTKMKYLLSREVFGFLHITDFCFLLHPKNLNSDFKLFLEN